MGKKISKTTAEKLCNNYDAKYTNLTKLIGKKDNRSIGFTLEELKQYIEYVEKNGKGINGIRIYLGSNVDTKLTTVFLAPTSNGVDDTSLNAYNVGLVGIPPSKKYGK